MSKSLGNGVDPIDVIERYGVDAMRYFITTNSTPGLDERYSETKMASSAAYLNKIWNACRYVEMTLGEDYKPSLPNKKELTPIDAAILDKLQKTIKAVTKKMDTYQFGQASAILYDFVYDDFCSSYLEMSKVALQKGDSKATKDTLFYIMKNIILMIYPYAPFITEEMYLSLPEHMDSIMLESYPEYNKSYLNAKAVKAVATLEEMIKDIRNYKSTSGLAPNEKVKLSISPKEPFPGASEYLARFAFASSISITKEELSGNTFLYGGCEMAVEEDIDKEALKAIVERPEWFQTISLSRMEDVHSVLIDGLGVERNLRHIRVGISGTNYRPLEVESQIREAVGDMCALVNGKSDPYEKALLTLLLISYIQPFVDGNKRTSRLMSNAMLIANGCCPLSFRTVAADDYRAALLLFYEQNNISAFKKIFLEQVAFAVNEYF